MQANQLFQNVDEDREVVELPMVQVRANNRDYDPFSFADIQRPGDEVDPATINDKDLLVRAERQLDLPEGTLDGYAVSRPETGNILIAPVPVLGG
jgi:hypothetical protein